MPLYQLLIYGTYGRLRYFVFVARNLCLNYVAYAMWDLDRLGYGTFVASVGRLRYVGSLSFSWSPLLWNLDHFRYVRLLVASAMRF